MHIKLCNQGIHRISSVGLHAYNNNNNNNNNIGIIVVAVVCNCVYIINPKRQNIILANGDALTSELNQRRRKKIEKNKKKGKKSVLSMCWSHVAAIQRCVGVLQWVERT
ncbi:Hypothetical predicted protein [Octopus vulgaris]|uniref:Uncharacterized protein n=1 Tax=Octopus vulgaris TaxID=6645 RepID=A0AA36F2A7_OCTVU|nr:Hypothetical predicted protein [Octopus vulgaris]